MSFIYHRRTVGQGRTDVEQSNLPRPNLAAEDTYGSGREDEVRSRREDGVGEVAAAKRFVAGIVES